MFDKIDTLRKLPEKQKRLIAFGSALGITGVIFVFWAVSLSVTLGSSGQPSLATNAGASGSGISPIAALEANVSAAVAPVGNVFNSFSSYFSPTSNAATTSVASAPAATSQVPANFPIPANTQSTENNNVVHNTVQVNSSIASKPVFLSSLLVPGDSGTDVVTLQNVLTAQGFYKGPINGKLGPATDAALIHFQAARGIIAANAPGSGQVGPKTRDAINALIQQ